MIPGGAYEPPKAAGEHDTQFQANPNYVTTFEILIEVLPVLIKVFDETLIEFDKFVQECVHLMLLHNPSD